jgi:hypothetical protein
VRVVFDCDACVGMAEGLADNGQINPGVDKHGRVGVAQFMEGDLGLSPELRTELAGHLRARRVFCQQDTQEGTACRASG